MTETKTHTPIAGNPVGGTVMAQSPLTTVGKINTVS